MGDIIFEIKKHIVSDGVSYEEYTFLSARRGDIEYKTPIFKEEGEFDQAVRDSKRLLTKAIEHTEKERL